MTSCQLPEEDREIWSQRCVAYETFSILVPDNDLNLLELLILLLNESKHSRLCKVLMLLEQKNILEICIL